MEIIERWYCNRVERYVRRGDGSLMPLDVREYLEKPFVEVNRTERDVSTGGRSGNIAGSVLGRRRG